jgi:hypothetical protein
MQTIYKYALSLGDFQTLQLCEGARPLHVAEQHGHLCLWAVVDTNLAPASYLIRIAGTGHALPGDLESWKYIGTVHTLGGAFVWHVWWRKED